MPAISPVLFIEIIGHWRKVSYKLNSLRVFFHYLYLNGIHIENLMLFLPASNRMRGWEPLPPVWEGGMLVKVNPQSIDKEIPLGNVITQ